MRNQRFESEEYAARWRLQYDLWLKAYFYHEEVDREAIVKRLSAEKRSGTVLILTFSAISLFALAVSYSTINRSSARFSVVIVMFAGLVITGLTYLRLRLRLAAFLELYRATHEGEPK